MHRRVPVSFSVILFSSQLPCHDARARIFEFCPCTPRQYVFLVTSLACIDCAIPEMNLSHVITEFSFGPYFPDIVQPLDYSFELAKERALSILPCSCMWLILFAYSQRSWRTSTSSMWCLLLTLHHAPHLSTRTNTASHTTFAN